MGTERDAGWGAPSWRDSMTCTSKPRFARRAAVSAPAAPAPTTMQQGTVGDSGRRSTSWRCCCCCCSCTTPAAFLALPSAAILTAIACDCFSTWAVRREPSTAGSIELKTCARPMGSDRQHRKWPLQSARSGVRDKEPRFHHCSAPPHLHSLKAAARMHQQLAGPGQWLPQPALHLVLSGRRHEARPRAPGQLHPPPHAVLVHHHQGDDAGAGGG